MANCDPVSQRVRETAFQNNTHSTDQIPTGPGQHGTYFYISVECASGTCANAPAHRKSFLTKSTTLSFDHISSYFSNIIVPTAEWEDVSLVLNEADATFGQNGGWEFGAMGGEMSTADQGRTWNFTTLVVPETAIQVAA